MTDYAAYREECKIMSIYQYHPMYRHRCRNPMHYKSDESRLILELKDLNENAISLLAERSAKWISQEDDDYGVEVICSVPSSDHNTHYNGIRLAAMKIANTLGYIDGTGCLVRTKDRQKSHFGNRSLDSHLSTLAVQQPDYVRGKRVLLVDDITTSGHSLVAGKRKLYEVGAASVAILALAETVYYGG